MIILIQIQKKIFKYPLAFLWGVFLRSGLLAKFLIYSDDQKPSSCLPKVPDWLEIVKLNQPT